MFISVRNCGQVLIKKNKKSVFYVLTNIVSMYIL